MNKLKSFLNYLVPIGGPWALKVYQILILVAILGVAIIFLKEN